MRDSRNNRVEKRSRNSAEVTILGPTMCRTVKTVITGVERLKECNISRSRRKSHRLVVSLPQGARSRDHRLVMLLISELLSGNWRLH